MSAILSPEPPAVAATESLQVIKRNGTLVGFNPSKITVAVTKAFLAVEGDQAAGSARINDAVHRVTEQVVQAISRRLKAGGKVHIEDIQDQVELARSEEHTSELQSRPHLVCRLLLEKKKKINTERV